MQVSDSAIGIMDGAFFVPKTQLIDWVNGLLEISISKVEQCASGAVYCQVIDCLYPGKVQMKKVNWGAKHEYEFVLNYKILQKAFDECGIAKHIDVDKLVRAKFQDNLEFMQWIKSFYEAHDSGSSYDPVSRRFGNNFPEWTKSSMKTSNPLRNSTPVISTRSDTPVIQKPDVMHLPTKSRDQIDFKQALIEMQKERDFYFGKLREIEILSDDLQDSPDPRIKDLIAQIQNILFSD